MEYFETIGLLFEPPLSTLQDVKIGEKVNVWTVRHIDVGPTAFGLACTKMLSSSGLRFYFSTIVAKHNSFLCWLFSRKNFDSVIVVLSTVLWGF